MFPVRAVPAVLVMLLLVAEAESKPIPKAAPDQIDKHLNEAWLDLLSSDELVVGRALFKLLAQPDETVRFLKDKLPPLQLKNERAKKLIQDLGSGNQEVARAAFEELSYFDPRLALSDEEMRDALLDRAPSRRLGALLCELPMNALIKDDWHWHSPSGEFYRFNYGELLRDRDVAISVKDIGRRGRNSHWVRAVRAVALLENIGGTKATDILQHLAKGHPDASPTIAAKNALEKAAKSLLRCE
jgi:hypothetical protein